GAELRFQVGLFGPFVVDDPDDFLVCHYHDPLAPPPPDLPPPPLNPPPPQPPPPPQSSRSRRPPPEKMLKRRSIARLGFVRNITMAMTPMMARKMNCANGIGCRSRRPRPAGSAP